MKAWGDPPVRRRDDPLVRRGTHAVGPSRLDSPIDPGPAGPTAVGILSRGARSDTDGRPLDGQPTPPLHEWLWTRQAARYRRLGSGADLGPEAIAAGSAALLRLGETIGPQELTDPVIAAAYRFARSRAVPVNVPRLLAEIAVQDDVQGEAAGPIRNALLPSIEAGFALHVAADDPWRDLFALWLLTRAPHALDDAAPAPGAIAGAVNVAGHALAAWVQPGTDGLSRLTVTCSPHWPTRSSISSRPSCRPNDLASSPSRSTSRSRQHATPRMPSSRRSTS